MEEKKVRVSTLLAYGSGDLFGGGAFLVIGMLFMFFLTETVGISPVWAGFVFAAGKVWDAVSDPLMGYLSDRTKSRFGRRRVFFLIGIIPIWISFFLMWVSIPGGSTVFKIFYYTFAYILFNTVFTMVMVPYSALNAEISSDFKERSRLSGTRSIFSGLAALLSGTMPRIIINLFPSESTGYTAMGAIFATLFALPWIFVFLGTWESEDAVLQDKGSALDIFRQFRTILNNRSFRIHLGMYICAYTATDILMALFAYFLTYYLKMPGLYSLAMGALLLTQILFMPFYVWLGNRSGKGFAYCTGMILWSTAMVISLLLEPTSSLIFIVLVCILMGTGTSAAIMIPWAILPSVIDVDEMISGKRRSGLYAGAMTLVRKMVQGLIALPLVGIILQKIDFQSNQAQTASTLQGLKTFYIAGPLILLIAGTFFALMFRITPETHGIFTDEAKRLKKGGHPMDVNHDTKDICEKITGMEYEKLGLVTASTVETA